MNWLVIALLSGIAAASLVTPAYAATCFELGNCTNTGNFVEWAAAPYQEVLGDFAFPLVWGLVIGLVYVKSQNSQLTTIVGMFLLTALVSTDSYLNSDSGQLYYWAIVIVAVGFACSMFYLIKIRVVNPA